MKIKAYYNNGDSENWIKGDLIDELETDNDDEFMDFQEFLQKSYRETIFESDVWGDF